MKSIARSVLALVGAGIIHAPSHAFQREHSFLPRQVGSGELLPLAKVLDRLRPLMRNHQYIGVDYEPQERTYRLKFLRDGQVSWIEVDARSGRPVGRAFPSSVP